MPLSPMIRLAHFSDVHLTVRALGWRVRDLFGKRATGWVNVRFLGRGKRFMHANRVVGVLMTELRERGFDHLIFSGDATTMAFDREITEAAKRLGAQAAVLCPGIPWHEIRGLGNWLRHDYDQIKVEVIWKTVQQDLRPLQFSAALALNQIEEIDGAESG